MSIYESVLESYGIKEDIWTGIYFTSSTMYRVNNLTASFRPGWNQYEGEYAVNSSGIDTFSIGMYGNMQVELPYGAYTMEITWDGKPYGYSNVYIGLSNYAYRLD